MAQAALDLQVRRMCGSNPKSRELNLSNDTNTCLRDTEWRALRKLLSMIDMGSVAVTGKALQKIGCELEIALGHVVCSELSLGELPAAEAEALLWEFNRILPFLCCSRLSAKGAQRVLLPLPVQLTLLSHILLCCSVLPQGKQAPCPVVALATTATQASCEANKQHNLASSITGVASLMDTVAVPILCMWSSSAEMQAQDSTLAAQQAALRQEGALFVQDLWCNAKVCSTPAIAARGALQVMSFLANLNRADCAEAHAVAFAAPDEYPSAFNRYAEVLKPHTSVIEVTGGAAAAAGEDETAQSGLVSYVPTPPRSAQSAAFEGLASAMEALTAHSTLKAPSKAVSHPFQLAMFVLSNTESTKDLHSAVTGCLPALRGSIAQATVAATVQLNAYILQESNSSYHEYAAGIDARTCAGVQLALCSAPWLAPAAACQMLDAASSAPASSSSDTDKTSKKRKSKKSKSSASAPAHAGGASPLALATAFAEARTAVLTGASHELLVQQCQSVLLIVTQLYRAGAVREDKDRSPFPLFSCLRFITEGVLSQLQALQAHKELAKAITTVLQNGRSIMQHKLPSMLALAAACAGSAGEEARLAMATALLTAGSDRQLPVAAFTATTSCILAATGALPSFAKPFAVEGAGAAGAGSDALGLLQDLQVAAAMVDTSLSMPNGQVVPFASLIGSLVAACATGNGVADLDTLQSAFVRGAGPVLSTHDAAGDKQEPVLAALGALISSLTSASSPNSTKAPKTPKSAKKRRRESSPAPVHAATHAAEALQVASCIFMAQVSTIRVTRSNFPSVASLANCMAQVVAQLLSGGAQEAVFSCGVQLLVCVQNMVAALSAYVPELSPTSAAWEGQWAACGWMACIPATVQAALGLLDGAVQSKSLMDVPFSPVSERLSSMDAVPGALRALLQRVVFAAAAFHMGDELAKDSAMHAGKVCLQQPSQRSEADVSVILSHLPVLEWACGSSSVQEWCAALHGVDCAQAPLLSMLSSEFTKESSQRAPVITAALFSACTSQAARSASRGGKSAKKRHSTPGASCEALGEVLESAQAVKAAMPSANSSCNIDVAVALARALQQCAACVSAVECARAVAVCLSIGCGSETCLQLLSSTPHAISALAAMSKGNQEWLLAVTCGGNATSAVAVQVVALALAAGGSTPALPSVSDLKTADASTWTQLAAAATAASKSGSKPLAAAAVPLVLAVTVGAAAADMQGAAMAAMQQVALLAAATLNSELLCAACAACAGHSVPQSVSLAVFKAAVAAEDAAFLQAAVQLWVSNTSYAGDHSLLTSLEEASGKTLAWLVAAACSTLAKTGGGSAKRGALLLLQACLQHPAAFDSAEVGQSAQVLVPQIPILLKQCSAGEAEVLLSAATAITASPSMVALTARDVTAILISATSFVAVPSTASHTLVLQVFTLLNQVAKHHKRVITAILPVASALLVQGLTMIKAEQGSAAADLSSMLYRCCVQLVRSARPAAVRHHAPQLVAAFVVAAAAQRHATSAAAASAESVSAEKAVLEGMYRIFDTMSASEFQHVFSAVAEYPGARQVLKTARKQWTAEHRYTGQ